MKRIEFIQYRKLKNLKIDFDDNINIIAGTNGTCKSSILHLISNSHQKVSNSSKNPVLPTIQKINKIFNPKIEALARGDKKYNDPAPGVAGTLYTAVFENYSLDFRRHNSKTINNHDRFAIKPKYKRGTSDRLPEIPIIYLGTFRLFSYGEWDGESKFKNIINKLPEKYLDELSELYKKFTGYEIHFDGKLNNFGGIRSKTEFSTTTKGIDSNTISAGEDNLLTILTSLVSLKAYYESINPDENNSVESINPDENNSAESINPDENNSAESINPDENNSVESILLIDELDASLHPEFQIKLINEFKEFSNEYKIQIFFTTHSFSLIDYSLDKRIGKLIYLTDQVDHVDLLSNINKYSINALLQNNLVQNIYGNTPIPVLLEDDEAKDFFNNLLQSYQENHSITIMPFFHIVDAKLPSEAIKALATDRYAKQSSIRTISIVDGDQTLDAKSLNHNLFSLPGESSPEELIFDYLKEILVNDDNFWKKGDLVELGYTKKYVQDQLLSQLAELETKLKLPGSHHGDRREGNKKIYQSDSDFWNYVMKYWIDNNEQEVNKFFQKLHISFYKTAPFYNIDQSKWPLTPNPK